MNKRKGMKEISQIFQRSVFSYYNITLSFGKKVLTKSDFDFLTGWSVFFVFLLSANNVETRSSVDVSLSILIITHYNFNYIKTNLSNDKKHFPIVLVKTRREIFFNSVVFYKSSSFFVNNNCFFKCFTIL